MKLAGSLLCALALASFSASAATATVSLASFGGNYKPTVRQTQLADDNDVFVDAYYKNLKIKINRAGRVKGTALFYTNNWTSVVPVKIKGRLSGFKRSGSGATADALILGNDGFLAIGSADVKVTGRKPSILFSIVKGDYHAFVLLLKK